jgi:hypothetical protein
MSALSFFWPPLDTSRPVDVVVGTPAAHWQLHVACLLSSFFHVRLVSGGASRTARSAKFCLELERRFYKDVAAMTSATLAWRPVPDDSSAEVTLDLCGSPPRVSGGRLLRLVVDDQKDAASLIDLLLAHRTPILGLFDMGQARLVGQSLPAIEDRNVLSRALAAVSQRIATLAADVIIAGQAALVESGASEPRLRARPGAFAFVLAATARKLSARLSARSVRHSDWFVATRRGPLGGPPRAEAPFILQEFELSGYVADPIVVSAGGESVIFAEWYDSEARRGKIVRLRVAAGDVFEDPKTILDEPFHLSYPIVFQSGNEWLLVPESAAAGSVRLYTATAFPDDWRYVGDIFPIGLADPTLVQAGELWWLFGTYGRLGSSDKDELFAFHADSLRGPWRAHPQNPVVRDARCARCAGPFIHQEGKLLRPAQNCDGGYGLGVVWREIVRLTPTEFVERTVSDWSAGELGVEALHTYSKGDLEAIDLVIPSRGDVAAARVRRRSALPGWIR